ncbi:SpoIIE family protein phosphatase [Streptomyces gibsoniae]|uniref:SpoIIE family protein phosphatase n=1 Tax=Streptomyces gibsoniae TaxID=3075529 RepID=A0ABU2TW13_9ACTN|nr:SpoIIE family protein phosphatase [Streptomyces sp. DSM 41699]MDT0465154.1 SpoIIE family protein phosphatase [Streptomyces sp. DSM 41699]
MMMSTDQAALLEPLGLREISDAAIAMIDEQGTVVAWTQAAQHVVGYCAEDVVGRSATLLLPSSEEALGVSAFAEQCRAQGGWSGTAAVRHRDGRTLNLNLRLSLLWGQDATHRWLVSLTDIGAFSSGMMNGSVRESLLARAPVGIAIRDPQLRCTWVNDTMEHDGISRDRRFGRRLKDSLPGFEAEALEAVMRQVLASGTSAVHEYRAWPPEDPRREHAFSASFFCLQGADGQALGVCSISVDVTSNQRARERLAILSQASTCIGSTLDIMQTAQELANLAVPLLADYAVVDLAESIPPFGDEPSARIDTMSDGPSVFRRAGLASIHPGIPESTFARGETISVLPNSPLANALRTGRSHLEPVLATTPGTWIDHDPARAQKIRENGVHSLMIVPIRARRSVLGVALFARTEDPMPFRDDDLLLAEELVTRAALSLDNARQYARERSTALALQRNLLPRRLRGGVAVEAAGRYLPADTDAGVGGDWFDVIPLSGARVALVVGDVVGHGINAAVAMGRLRAAVRTLADLDLPPDELLNHLDDSVRRLTGEDDDAPDQIPAIMGATCVYAVYDPATRQCTMARAGHPPPAIVDAQGQVTFPDLPTGAPLGLGLGLVPFDAVEVELPEGSLLAFYTDGLVESRDEDIDVGMHRLGTALAQPEQSLEDLCSSVVETVPTQTASDDVALLLVRIRTLNAAHVASWDLPTEPAVVSDARHLAARQLSEWGLEHLVPTTELIISELVTNAIRHGAGPIRLRLIQHQVLTCEVFDSGQCYPRLRHARIVDENGRGLFLIAQLSNRWGFRSATGGKLVWVDQDLPSTL